MKHHPARPRISDHAVVRYLERIKGVDIEAVRAEIMALCAHAFETEAQAMVVGGHRYVIATDMTVTTVEPIGYARSVSRTRQMRLSEGRPKPEACLRG